MQPCLPANVLNCQRKTCFVASDGLVLRAVIGKYPLHILHAGHKEHICHKNTHAHRTLNEVQHQIIVHPTVQKTNDDHGQHKKQQYRQAQTEKDSDTKDHLLKSFIAKLLFQPKIEFGRFFLLQTLRRQICRTHQCLNTHHLGIKEVHSAADQRPGCKRVYGAYLPCSDLKLDLIAGAHSYCVLFRAAHHNAFNQCLTANAGLKFFAAGLRIVFAHKVPSLL